MAGITITLDLAGERQVKRTFERLGAGIDDATPLWEALAEEIYERERRQFATQGGAGAHGKWSELSPRYAKEKKAAVGFIKPILVRHGFLRAAATSGGAIHSIRQIEPHRLTIGIRLPYARAHQLGHNVPQRKVYDFLQDNGELTASFKARFYEMVRDWLRGVVADSIEPGMGAGSLAAPTYPGGG